MAFGQQQQQQQSKDHWSAKAYTAAASFVPQLTSVITTYLSPKPGESILDLGCGDGVLTSQIATAISSTGHIDGLDASPSFIASAQSTYANVPNVTFTHHDCTDLGSHLKKNNLEGSYDKVFSNAALHWILREPSTRTRVFQDSYAALKAGGLLVFEMGAHGNVPEAHAALTGALVHFGLSIDEAREASPWFFPSDVWIRSTLENIGFEVVKAEIAERPTRLTEKKEDGSGGLEGWVDLMGAEFLDKLPTERKKEAVKWVCEVLEGVVTRVEDGSQWLQYKRLRVVAKKN